jgi:hypothetical protein
MKMKTKRTPNLITAALARALVFITTIAHAGMTTEEFDGLDKALDEAQKCGWTIEIILQT